MTEYSSGFDQNLIQIYLRESNYRLTLRGMILRTLTIITFRPLTSQTK